MQNECCDASMTRTVSTVDPSLPLIANTTFTGLARTICIYDIFGKEITKYTFIHSVKVQIWPALDFQQEISNHRRVVVTAYPNSFRRTFTDLASPRISAGNFEPPQSSCHSIPQFFQAPRRVGTCGFKLSATKGFVFGK
jgi:hypothetical protein